ncbi:MAG: retropepsin-like aspartic protease [Prosthecobacter sp.]
MPSFTDRGLVVIQATIGPDQARRDYCDRYQERYAADVTAPALIDTGAEVCVVDLAILESLHLQAHDERNLNGVNGDSVLRPVFNIWLKVLTKDGTVVIDQPNQEVFGVNFVSGDYKIILGMDVLRSITLQINRDKHWVRLCRTTDDHEPL